MRPELIPAHSAVITSPIHRKFCGDYPSFFETRTRNYLAECYHHGMTVLLKSNKYLRDDVARKVGIERNVRSSSAVEGISTKTFEEAVSGKTFVASVSHSGQIKLKRAK